MQTQYFDSSHYRGAHRHHTSAWFLLALVLLAFSNAAADNGRTTSASLIPLGTPEYPGLCPYRGHSGKYQCKEVSPIKHGKSQKTACKGKDLYLSGGNCYTCPEGYKRSLALKKMTDPKACVKHQRGKNPKAAGIFVRKSYLGCPDGQFKFKGYCYTCPAKTKRMHVAGLDKGKCKVNKAHRCNSGLKLHKSAPKNFMDRAGNWIGLKHKKYCGEPFSFNLFSAEVLASEVNQKLAQAVYQFGRQLAKNDNHTRQKIANFKQAVKDKKLARAYEIVSGFDGFENLTKAAEEGQQFAITVGVGGDGSFGIGYDHEIGLAIDIGQRKLKKYQASGLSKGFSLSAAGSISVGIWAGAFQTGYSQGYVGSVNSFGIGVWTDYYTPKRSDGLNQPHLIGLSGSFGAGAGFEIGEYNEVYTKVYD